MEEHYLDNSATTRCCSAAAQAALRLLTDRYGNPSSLHRKGIEAEQEVELARERIADSLSVSAKNILFTSGSTESNNTVLFGVSDAYKRRGRRVIVSAVEHPSVYESAKALGERGFDVQFAPVDSDGVVLPDRLEELLTPATVLISVMAVNNETGAIQPVREIGRLVKKKTPAVYHIDAVQAYGKLPLHPRSCQCDFMSVSAHKVHGPKGIGALYVADGARFTPLLYGGEQQKKRRPGTEASALIAAFGEAVAAFDIDGNYRQISALNRYTREQLATLGDVAVNSSDSALPYIINLSVKGIRSETMLHHLAQNGVYVSSSSACAKGRRSYVLAAMGLSDDRIDSSIRVSFSKYNTTQDVDALINGLRTGLASLQRKRK